MGGIESFRRALLLFVWRITINNEYNKARLARLRIGAGWGAARAAAGQVIAS